MTLPVCGTLVDLKKTTMSDWSEQPYAPLWTKGVGLTIPVHDPTATLGPQHPTEASWQVHKPSLEIIQIVNGDALCAQRGLQCHFHSVCDAAEKDDTKVTSGQE